MLITEFCRTRKRILATLILVVIMLNIMPEITFASEGVFAIEMDVDKTEVYPGEEITFTIKYSYSSSTSSAANATIVDTLPLDLIYLGYVDSDVIQSVTENNNIVTFTFNNNLNDGTTGTLKIMAKFKEGITQKDVIINNSATIDADNIDNKTSNIVTVKTKIKDPDFTITKERVIPNPSTTPTLNSDVKYKITITSNSTIGGLNLTDLVITDTIEENSSLEDAPSGYNQNNNIISWDLSELSVGQTKSYYITVSYPDTNFDIADTVENNVTVKAKVYGDDTTIYTRSDSVSHGFATSDPKINGISKTSRQSNDEYYYDQIAKFYINGLENSGNVPLDEFVLIDTVPVELDITSITTGSFTNANGGNVTVSFKTNENSWRIWGINSVSSSETYDLLDITPPLNATEYITEIKWDYGTVVPGFAQSSNINVFGKVLMIDNENNLIKIKDPPYEITNSVQLTASYTEVVGDPPEPVTQTFDQNSSETIKVVDAQPWIVANKTVVGNSAAFEGDYVEFNLQIKNHEFATGDFVSPVAIEKLPAELEDFEFLRWYDETGTSHDYDAGNNVTNFTPYAKDSINYFKWTFSGITLEPGEDVNIRVKAKIKEETKAGFVNNTFYIFPNGIDYKSSGSETDTDDHDNDGNTTEKTVPSTTKFFVKFKGNLTSDKWQRGELDDQTEDGWNQYPDHGQTVPGGISDYRLVVENKGSNGPISNIVIIDVLPRINDKGIIDTRPRLSAWRPNLVNKITGKDGAILDSRITVYYSTEEAPDLSQLYDPTTKVTDGSDGWSTDVPEDITSVTALKFDFGDIVLQPDDGTQVVLEWPMRAPVGTPEEYIAWNTFAYGATYPDEKNGVEVQEPFLPSEPKKVGFEVKEQQPVNLGDFIWEDMNMNGEQDAGEPGINGVLVELFKHGNPNRIAYTRSGDSHPEDPLYSGQPGFYLFPNIEDAGEYYVKFTLPSYFPEYLVTPQNVLGVDESKDSDVDPISWESDRFVLNGVDDNLDVDLGIYRKASIGDLVWNDRDMDGIQGSDEPGIDNIVVKLYEKIGDTYTDTKIKCVTGDKQYIFDNDSGTYIPYGNSVSLDKGEYIFTQLDPGTYQLEFLNYDESDDTLELYKISPIKQGSDTSRDSNVQHLNSDPNYLKTEEIIVVSGDKITDIDAGMYMAELGNLIWHDLDADGIKDSNESGIDNVTVELFNDTISLGTTETDSSGYYEFIDLIPDNYHIEVVNPGYDAISPWNSMGNDNDNDLNSFGVTNTVSLTAGERYYKLDGGFFNYAKVGDLIWNDKDHDGSQDGLASEPGISNIVVRLFDTSDQLVKGPLNTDANGGYSFSGLTPGDYYIKVEVPANYKVSNQNQVSDSVDSDIDASGKTANFTLTSGQNKKDVDGGLHKALIGDYVWQDMNADGIQNDNSAAPGNNAGIENVGVMLLDSGKNQIGSTIQTDANGYYQFTDLDSGTYFIKFAPPAEFETTTKGAGTNSSDSDVNDADQTTDQIILDVGETEKTIDAGYWKPASIGNLVWHDINGNGIQDGEPGIDGVNVELYKDGVPTTPSATTATTSGGGFYTFDDLIPGNYSIKVTVPLSKDGYIDQDTGSDDFVDSDVDIITGITANTDLVSGEDDDSWDAGLYNYVTIGNYVWEDTDADGIQDGSESFVKDDLNAEVNIKITAYRNGAEYRETTTNSGNYLFDDIMPGQYQLKIDRPEGYSASPKDNGDDTKDSDYAKSTNMTELFQMDSGASDDTWDFGLYPSNSLGDLVWVDSDGDSIQDGNENGLENVEVALYMKDPDDIFRQLTTTSTNSSGEYKFENLDAGIYKVGLTIPDGYFLTDPDVGGDDALDSDIDKNTELSGEYSFIADTASDNYIDTADIGLYELGKIGNFVWDDYDADGIQDEGEPGLSNVTVTLRDKDGNSKGVYVTKAANPGYYMFEDLSPGDYYVTFLCPTDYVISPQNSGSNDNIDSDIEINGSLYKTHTISLRTGVTDDSLDAGFYNPASIGSLVWEDENGNGIQDNGEPGIENVTVELYKDGSGIEATTTTDDKGEYLFDDLVPGDYFIKVIKPAVYDGFIDLDMGSNDNIDSDVDSGGISIATTLISGEDDMSWDAGLYKSVTIGDYIWKDENANGIQEGEPNFAGINVTLYRDINSVFTDVGSITTDADGKYLFTDQKPGEFYVEIDKPSNYRVTVKDEATTDDNNDSDAITSTNAVTSNDARTDNFIVKSGKSDLTRDIGLYLKNSLGDKVWLDNNGDGLQTGEDGVSGIKVYLYDTNGFVVSDTTDAQGAYFFDNLNQGTYDVRLKKSEIETLGYTVTDPNTSSNNKDDIDSDLDPNTFISTETYTFKSDNHDITVDIGLYELATIGNYVWEDKNGDGIQNETTTGIEDVKVELFDLEDNLVKETKTDSNGLYQITGIVPGDYYVKFTAQSNYVVTQQNIDSDNTDSDVNSEGKTATITLDSGDLDVSIDAGYYIPIIIGNKIWEDNNADGLQNDGDSGIDGVFVEIYKNGSPFDSFTTVPSAKGEYKFTGLAPGSYHIKVTKPNDFIFSDKGPGTSNDSDVDILTGESNPKTYVSGDIDLDIDIGMYKLVSIGDKVWLDDNADGIQNGESGINDVTVKLYQDDVYKDSVTTAGDGDYEFTDLMPGNYSIEVIKDSNYYFTIQDNGSDDSIDSDINPVTSQSVTKFVPSSSIIQTWDGGLYLENSIGDKVWLDENGNGLQDSDEPGINGVTVKLYKSGVTDPIATYETGSGLLAEGEYLFENLEAGTYTIGVDRPTGYHLTDENNGDDTIDSDVDQSTEKTSEYVLQSDDHIRHVDIGLYKLTTIGDYAWNDLDADGKQETGESGIAGIDVTLHKTNGSQVGSKITTGGDGVYQFSGIAPGEYYVKFKLPIGSDFVATAHNAASDDNDSDITKIDAYNFKTHNIGINTNEIDETLDAGFYIPAKLGDFVWEDMNGNGIQDDGEPGVGGVEIELFNGSESTGLTTTTAADGSYSFSDLEPGTYHIKVISLPNGYNGFITMNKGSNDTIDSDVNNSGVSESVVLISGSDDEDLDIGIYKYASIGNFVWEDLNADGTQDDDETFIKDSNGDEIVIQVNLFKSDESPEIEFNTTTTNGIYSFTNLIPGEYRVEFELLSNYYISAQNAVGNIETDSNPDKVTGKTAAIHLKSGVPDNSIDCGMYKSNSIGNKVWHDENGNGIQDDSEGIADIEVRLYDSSGSNLIKSDLTDANGEYLFSNLEQGSYRIGIADKKEYTITTKNVDGNTKDDEDSDIDKDSMISDSDKLYVLTSNTHIDTADIGLYILGSIGNYVWEDMDGDGEQDDTEPFINDVTVKLYKNGSKIDECSSPLTDGNYLFSDLAPGTYELRFSKPTGYHFTVRNTVSNSSDSDVDENGEITYTLKSNEDNMKLDAGLVRRGDIGDYVWNDSNKNGIQDTNEQGLDKYKVKLIYSEGSYQETETNAIGYYEFTDLQPGEYQVQFYPKSDFVITKENEGTDDSKDSNPDPSTGITPKFSLLSGNDVKTIDAGMYFVPDQELGIGEGSIGDYVWIDSDKDGIQDSNEKGVEGVKVILSPKNAERIETYTDSNGKYLFDLLPDGLYSVRVEEPVGYKTTIRNAGSNKDKDSDANKNGFIEVVRLTNSADLRNIDIGLIGTAELGDFVWDDLNSNGSQDFGEPGVENVTVYLLDNNKNAIMQTKTDSDGKYLFTDLAPGIYYVEIEIPYMYEMTLKNNSQEYKDSNGSADGMSDDVYLNPGQKRSDVDFGIKKQIPEAEIGNYVWADCSDDGVQDSFEDGVPNITVKLLDKNKTVIDTTITDNQGYYLFTNVYEGEYYIEVVLPAGISTAKRYAALENNDSNASADGLTGKIPLAQKQKEMSIDIGLVKYGDVEGIITDDETGEPLANIDVVVKNRKGRVITTVTTDNEGKYTIENISLCMEISLEVIKNDQSEETYEETPVGGEVDVPDDEEVTEGEKPKNGTVTIDKEGNWKYTPDPGFIGKDNFTIIIKDKDGNEEEIFIEIDVEEIPLGAITELPDTGESSNLGIYLVGLLFILAGIVLKKKLR